jgi:methylenetetrahydrofolate reductase (NADPH)
VSDPIAKFEILPFARGEEEAARLPEPVRLTVTCSPKHGLDRTIEVAGRLRTLGHAVTVHLAARMVRDGGHLDEVLEAMAASGVDDAFVIGGDATPPHGPYSSALDLLPLIWQHPQRPSLVGIAGYPEGHPLIDDATLAEVLAAKTRYADYVTTQLCFDPEAILRWIETTELPVVVGLPGKVDRKKLLEISVRVGVGPSLSFLRKQGGVRSLLRLSQASADSLRDALAPHRDEIAGFHYFTFNRLVDTWQWVRGKGSHRTRIAADPRKDVPTISHHPRAQDPGCGQPGRARP